MSVELWVTPRAATDITDLAIYLGRKSPDAAARFLDAVDATIDQISASPGIGHRFISSRPRLQDMRVSRVTGFENHLVFYQPAGSGYQVVRVLHGARDIESAWDET